MTNYHKWIRLYWRYLLRPQHLISSIKRFAKDVYLFGLIRSGHDHLAPDALAPLELLGQAGLEEVFVLKVAQRAQHHLARRQRPVQERKVREVSAEGRSLIGRVRLSQDGQSYVGQLADKFRCWKNAKFMRLIQFLWRATQKKLG